MKIKLENQIIGTGDVKGFIFTQKKKSKQGYVYEVDDNDDNKHYEVFKKKEVALCIDFAKHIYSETDTKEVYPKSKDFGVWAWTFRRFVDAQKCLESF